MPEEALEWPAVIFAYLRPEQTILGLILKYDDDDDRDDDDDDDIITRYMFLQYRAKIYMYILSFSCRYNPACVLACSMTLIYVHTWL